MLNYNDFKYSLTVEATLESLNNSITMEKINENNDIFSEYVSFINEADTQFDFLKPVDSIQAMAKEIPVLGGVIGKMQDAKALGKVKKAQEAWKKLTAAKTAKEVQFWIMQDKAKKNGNGKEMSAEAAKDAIGKLTSTFDDKIKAVEQDWNDAVGEIEDADLKKEKNAEMQSVKLHMKAEIADKYADKYEEIAQKKLGFTDDQIKKMKDAADKSADKLRAIEDEAEKMNDDATKDMNPAQKSDYEAEMKRLEDGPLTTKASVKANATKYSDKLKPRDKSKEDGGAKELWDAEEKYEKALGDLISGIKSQSADNYKAWKTEGGKELFQAAKDAESEFEPNWKKYFNDVADDTPEEIETGEFSYDWKHTVQDDQGNDVEKTEKVTVKASKDGDTVKYEKKVGDGDWEQATEDDFKKAKKNDGKTING